VEQLAGIRTVEVREKKALAETTFQSRIYRKELLDLNI
jgi:hypothetical protein